MKQSSRPLYFPTEEYIPERLDPEYKRVFHGGRGCTAPIPVESINFTVHLMNRRGKYGRKKVDAELKN